MDTETFLARSSTGSSAGNSASAALSRMLCQCWAFFTKLRDAGVCRIGRIGAPSFGPAGGMGAEEAIQLKPLTELDQSHV